MFKGDLIKFCEIFLQKTLWSSQNSQKPFFNMLTQQSVIFVYFFIKCLVKWSENSVRFESLIGIGFQMGQILHSVRYGMYEQLFAHT